MSLRIAFLTPEFVSEAKFDGGLANYLHRVSQGLSSLGHHVEIFVLADRDETITHEGILVHRVKRRPLVAWNRFRKGLRRLGGPDLSYSCYVRDGATSLARALKTRLADQPFDIVQASDFGATALALPKERPYQLVSRLSWYAPLWRKAYEHPWALDRLIAERMERRSLRKSDAIYGPSQRIARVVQAAVGRPVTVLRPPATLSVDEAELDHSVYQRELEGVDYLLFYGRLCRLKGVLQLARAARFTFTSHPNLRLVLVGREDPPGILDELRVILGPHASRLQHFERLRHPQLFPIIRGARCVVLPSRIDNFPNAGIEAMLNRQILVGTREASFDELIDDGVSGYLVSSDDDASLSRTLTKVLALSPAEREAIGHQASAAVTKFDGPSTLAELTSFFERVIAPRPAKGISKLNLEIRQ